MNKITDILKFTGCLLLLFVVPTLVYTLVDINRRTGQIGNTAALYQTAVFAAVAAPVLILFYRAYRTTCPIGGYFAEPAGIPLKRKLCWGAFYLALMLLAGEYGLHVLNFFFGTPIKDTENQQAIIEWTRHLPVAVVLADVVLFAPLAEEWLFRGTLFGLFGRSLELPAGRALAFLSSSLLFGFMHSGTDIPALVLYGTLGAVLSAAYLHLRDIRYPIAVHMANNAVAIASVYLSS